MKIFDMCVSYPVPVKLCRVMQIDETYSFKSDDSKYVCMLLDYDAQLIRLPQVRARIQQCLTQFISVHLPLQSADIRSGCCRIKYHHLLSCPVPVPGIGPDPQKFTLMLEETYSFKSDDSKYVCMLLDYDAQSPVDVLPSRKKEYLAAYFRKFPRSERDRVEFHGEGIVFTIGAVAVFAFVTPGVVDESAFAVCKLHGPEKVCCRGAAAPGGFLSRY